MSRGILQELILVNYQSKNTPPHPSWTFLKEYQPNIILRRRDDIKGELVSLLWHSVNVQIYRYLCLLLNMNTKIVTAIIFATFLHISSSLFNVGPTYGLLEKNCKSDAECPRTLTANRGKCLKRKNGLCEIGSEYLQGVPKKIRQ